MMKKVMEQMDTGRQKINCYVHLQTLSKKARFVLALSYFFCNLPTNILSNFPSLSAHTRRSNMNSVNNVESEIVIDNRPLVVHVAVDRKKAQTLEVRIWRRLLVLLLYHSHSYARRVHTGANRVYSCCATIRSGCSSFFFFFWFKE